MGFIDSIKEALGGEQDDGEPAPASDSATPSDNTPRHADPDAEESPYEPVTGGKHAARD